MTVRNSGRIPITVNGCCFRSGGGIQFSTIGRPDWGSDTFPIRIEAGASKTLVYRTVHALELDEYIKGLPPKPRNRSVISRFIESVKNDPAEIRVQVQLGNGKAVECKPALSV